MVAQPDSCFGEMTKGGSHPIWLGSKDGGQCNSVFVNAALNVLWRDFRDLTVRIINLKWSAWPDLNRRPSAPKADALPTALHAE